MRRNENVPLNARKNKRKRLKKRRFFILVVLTVATAYYISYALSRTGGNDYLETFNSQSGATVKNSTLLLQQPSLNDFSKDDPGDYTNIDNSNSEETDSTISVTGITMQKKPLFDTAINQNTMVSNINYEILRKNLQNYIKNKKGKYGIYYLNLADGYEFGINHMDEFVAASTVKIPINLYLFKKIKNGSVNPDGIMKYTQKDYEAGTGRIQREKQGKKYTVRELSELSITVSDNVAANMLLRLLGIKNVKNYMRQSGGTVVYNDRNMTCPKDMGLYMKMAYEFSKEDSVLGKELLGYFLNTCFPDRIPKLLPKDVKVAHKIGTQVNTVNDVGIVYTQKPYILVVLSSDVDLEEAPDTVASISKMVYDSVK